MRKYKFHKIIKVYCKECKEWIDETTVEFVDICEGIQGEDLLTFICPTCKTKSQSRRIG